MTATGRLQGVPGAGRRPTLTADAAMRSTALAPRCSPAPDPHFLGSDGEANVYWFRPPGIDFIARVGSTPHVAVVTVKQEPG